MIKIQLYGTPFRNGNVLDIFRRILGGYPNTWTYMGHFWYQKTYGPNTSEYNFFNLHNFVRKSTCLFCSDGWAWLIDISSIYIYWYFLLFNRIGFNLKFWFLVGYKFEPTINYQYRSLRSFKIPIFGCIVLMFHSED